MQSPPVTKPDGDSGRTMQLRPPETQLHNAAYVLMPRSHRRLDAMRLDRLVASSRQCELNSRLQPRMLPDGMFVLTL